MDDVERRGLFSDAPKRDHFRLRYDLCSDCFGWLTKQGACSLEFKRDGTRWVLNFVLESAGDCAGLLPRLCCRAHTRRWWGCNSWLGGIIGCVIGYSRNLARTPVGVLCRWCLSDHDRHGCRWWRWRMSASGGWNHVSSCSPPGCRWCWCRSQWCRCGARRVGCRAPSCGDYHLISRLFLPVFRVRCGFSCRAFLAPVSGRQSRCS